jgi:predicted acylesterase/phospholipase RssA
MTLGELRTKRIGLLFSGGGAKGAYQIGCWKALRALGLDDFRAIAGSSVGAMNAVLVGTGHLHTAETVWRNLRLRDVVGVRLRRLPRLPLWIVAAIGSEFSPIKTTRLSDLNGHHRRLPRWLHTVTCVAAAAVLVAARPILPAGAHGWAWKLALVAVMVAALARLHRITRPIFLAPALTDNAPLARTLELACADHGAERLRAAQCPVYGVLSCYAPHAQGSHQWGGWAPVYVRLDQMDAATLRRTLLTGSALPGVFAADTSDGRLTIDGSWTDNVPAAPLLFGGDAPLDILIVVYLKQKVRHIRRPNSLCALIQLLISERWSAGAAREDLRSWAATRWRAYRSSGLASNGPHGEIASQGPEPMLIDVAPSKRVGNFFTGTLWFSRAKSAALIELGERDMRAAIARLVDDVEEPAAAGGATALDRDRGTQAAVLGPAHS